MPAASSQTAQQPKTRSSSHRRLENLNHFGRNLFAFDHFKHPDYSVQGDMISSHTPTTDYDDDDDNKPAPTGQDVPWDADRNSSGQEMSQVFIIVNCSVYKTRPESDKCSQIAHTLSS